MLEMLCTAFYLTCPGPVRFGNTKIGNLSLRDLNLNNTRLANVNPRPILFIFRNPLNTST